MTILAPLPVQSFKDSNGNPLAGGLLYTYVAGTSTPQATFTDVTGATPNTNPIVLNSRGEASIWLPGGLAYKWILNDAASNLIWTVDQLSSPVLGGNPVSIVSAATTDIGGQSSTAIEVSGTNTITSLGTNYSGPRFVRFTGALTLTYSLPAINLPSAANITTAAGDVAIFYPNLALTGWNLMSYTKFAGLAASAGANADITSLGNNTSTIYTTAGTATAYTITPAPVIATYAIGQSFMVNFALASGASPTLQANGIATPPQLVKENADGTYSNIAANDFPINHRSRVTLISATQALLERLPATTGTVLQMLAFASDVGGGTTSGTVTNLSAASKSITPKSTNSVLAVTCYFYGASALLAAVNTVAFFQAMEGAVGVGQIKQLGVSTGSGGNGVTAPCVITARLTNTSLAARNFTLGGYTNNASSTASAIDQIFTITEIQA